MLAVKYQVITVRNKQNKVHLSSDLSTTKCKVFRFKRKVALVVDNRQLARGSYVFLRLAGWGDATALEIHTKQGFQVYKDK